MQARLLDCSLRIWDPGFSACGLLPVRGDPAIATRSPATPLHTRRIINLLIMHYFLQPPPVFATAFSVSHTVGWSLFSCFSQQTRVSRGKRKRKWRPPPPPGLPPNFPGRPPTLKSSSLQIPRHVPRPGHRSPRISASIALELTVELGAQSRSM